MSVRAQVIRSTGSWYEVMTPEGSLISCRLRGRHKLQSKRYTNPIAVGDYVHLEKVEQDWLIDSIEDRQQFLVRKASNLSRKYHVIAANIDQMFVLVTANHPYTPLGFVDRILVMAEKAGIPACIVLNKIDLYDGADLDRLEGIEQIYQNAGYSVLRMSLQSGDGLDEVILQMSGKTNLLVGNSGVGKTTLLNRLFPEQNQKTAEISESYGKGRHTTTFATMYAKTDMRVIDTPGIKEFGLVDVELAELGRYFPEIRRASESCRFSDCMHLKEPDCEVIRQFAEGLIDEERYQSYILMTEELSS